jgi:hypothetical protein
LADLQIMIGFKLSPVAETHNARVILSLLMLCPSVLLLARVVDDNNLKKRLVSSML